METQDFMYLDDKIDNKVEDISLDGKRITSSKIKNNITRLGYKDLFKSPDLSTGSSADSNRFYCTKHLIDPITNKTYVVRNDAITSSGYTDYKVSLSYYPVEKNGNLGPITMLLNDIDRTSTRDNSTSYVSYYGGCSAYYERWRSQYVDYAVYNGYLYGIQFQYYYAASSSDQYMYRCNLQIRPTGENGNAFFNIVTYRLWSELGFDQQPLRLFATKNGVYLYGGISFDLYKINFDGINITATLIKNLSGDERQILYSNMLEDAKLYYTTYDGDYLKLTVYDLYNDEISYIDSTTAVNLYKHPQYDGVIKYKDCLYISCSGSSNTSGTYNANYSPTVYKYDLESNTFTLVRSRSVVTDNNNPIYTAVGNQNQIMYMYREAIVFDNSIYISVKNGIGYKQIMIPRFENVPSSWASIMGNEHRQTIINDDTLYRFDEDSLSYPYMTYNLKTSQYDVLKIPNGVPFTAGIGSVTSAYGRPQWFIYKNDLYCIAVLNQSPSPSNCKIFKYDITTETWTIYMNENEVMSRIRLAYYHNNNYESQGQGSNQHKFIFYKEQENGVFMFLPILKSGTTNVYVCPVFIDMENNDITELTNDIEYNDNIRIKKEGFGMYYPIFIDNKIYMFCFSLDDYTQSNISTYVPVAPSVNEIRYSAPYNRNVTHSTSFYPVSASIPGPSNSYIPDSKYMYVLDLETMELKSYNNLPVHTSLIYRCEYNKTYTYGKSTINVEDTDRGTIMPYKNTMLIICYDKTYVYDIYKNEWRKIDKPVDGMFKANAHPQKINPGGTPSYTNGDLVYMWGSPWTKWLTYNDKVMQVGGSTYRFIYSEEVDEND